MVKKAFVLFVMVLCLLLFNSLTLYSSAANNVEFKVISQQNREQVEYYVQISDNSCVSALTLEFSYDADLLHLTKSSCSSLLDVGMSTINDKKTGMVTMAFVSAKQLKSSGEIMRLVFQIKSGYSVSEIKTHLTIKTAADAAGKNIPTTIIQAYKPVNSDIDNLDVETNNDPTKIENNKSEIIDNTHTIESLNSQQNITNDSPNSDSVNSTTEQAQTLLMSDNQLVSTEPEGMNNKTTSEQTEPKQENSYDDTEAESSVFESEQAQTMLLQEISGDNTKTATEETTAGLVNKDSKNALVIIFSIVLFLLCATIIIIVKRRQKK